MRTLTERLSARSAPRTSLLGALVLLAAVDAALTQPASKDAITDSLRWSGAAVSGLAWPALAVVAACSVVHYLAAAAATRSAVRSPLPHGETVLAQLCAAAANKITPAGLGGSAVLARYLRRRTGMPLASAAGTVSVIALGRAVAAALTLAVLAIAGPWFGLGGGTAEVGALLTRFASAVGAHEWVVPLLVGLLAATTALAIRAAGARRQFVRPLREILRHPRSATLLLAASAAQTLVLGVAFAAAVHVVPGVTAKASAAALVVGYIVAAAFAAAVPMPGGLGSSEAALTAVLVGAHVGLGHAVTVVLLFRIATLWLPALAGIPCARVLRRRAAL